MIKVGDDALGRIKGCPIRSHKSTYNDVAEGWRLIRNREVAHVSTFCAEADGTLERSPTSANILYCEGELRQLGSLRVEVELPVWGLHELRIVSFTFQGSTSADDDRRDGDGTIDVEIVRRRGNKYLAKVSTLMKGLSERLDKVVKIDIDEPTRAAINKYVHENLGIQPKNIQQGRSLESEPEKIFLSFYISLKAFKIGIGAPSISSAAAVPHLYPAPYDALLVPETSQVHPRTPQPARPQTRSSVEPNYVVPAKQHEVGPGFARGRISMSANGKGTLDSDSISGHATTATQVHSRIRPPSLGGDSLQKVLTNYVHPLLRSFPKVLYYQKLERLKQGRARASDFAEIARTLYYIDLDRNGQRPKSQELVSIIMPTHNRASVVEQAIKSVADQTYTNWELVICDDGSEDETFHLIGGIKDPRVKYTRHSSRQGAPAARNTALQMASGGLVAYLDTDNIWHPRYLELLVEEFLKWPGSVSAYAKYLDVDVGKEGSIELRSVKGRKFHLEDHLEKPFIDLNSFMHRRHLYEVFGGFDVELNRRQDYDLIARYTWVQEPRFIPFALNLYQRNVHLEQITRTLRGDMSAPAIIDAKIKRFYAEGVPANFPRWMKKVSVLSWDMSRNHYAKAFCVADALSEHAEVELISFSFFPEGYFEPLSGAKPRFPIRRFEGGKFPDFFDAFAKGINAITGDAIYALKPRLTSFGLGLLANYHTGKPLMLECNDLETVVASARARDAHTSRSLESIFSRMEESRSPYSQIWSEVLDPLVAEIPSVYTHNVNLNLHYDRRCLNMRNVKDGSVYDPGLFNRDKLRSELGYKPADRVILFGGLVRTHKGIFELLNTLERLNDARYRLLVVGNRDTPDLARLKKKAGDKVVFMGPQPPERMAALNYAADLVLLWLDPDVAAGHYQSPYKMSDAFAMGAAVIATPTSDLAVFGDREILYNIPYGDHESLISLISEMFRDPSEVDRRRARARSFFLREFSYLAVRPSVALGAWGLSEDQVYPVAERFAAFFSNYERRWNGNGSI